jgi:hypothetical protein
VWGAVFEARNTTPAGGGTSVNHVLAGIEVDVVNGLAFSDVAKKIGVEVISFGGFEATDGFAVHAANGTFANGTYGSGGWRYGFRIYDNALNPTLSSGLWIDSDHGRGIHITGVSATAAIDLAADAATTFGILIGTNYTVPIGILANKTLRLNHGVDAAGILYASALTGLILSAPSIGVTAHTTFTSATAGANGAVPAQVDGYLGFWVNGIFKRVPYFNA